MNIRLRAAAQTIIAAFATCLIVVASAGAATVVNGDFESGNLDGWQVVNDPSVSGSWFAYAGTTPPTGLGGEVPPPPAGNFAAITAQGGPGSHFLYQDIALEPFYAHQLSLLAYYRSSGEMVVPSPDTLTTGFEEPENQQYRIDVIKPTAPITTLEPVDILATVFATGTGAPVEMAATNFTVDLTPFAGQTVRLRFVEVDNNGPLNAGTDSVSIVSTPPSNAVMLGKPALNKKKGTAKLPVTVPGAGTLTIADVKKSKKRIKAKTLTATAAGTLKLPVKPTKSARKTLENKGKLKLKVAVTFTPTGGLAATVTKKLTLKLAPK